MKTYKKRNRKKKTYIILCCEILLITTLVAGIGLYAYSASLKENGIGNGSEGSIAVQIATPKEENLSSSLAERIESLTGEEGNTPKQEDASGENDRSKENGGTDFLNEEKPVYTYEQGIKWFEPKKEGETVLAFAGDILFDDEYAAMVSIESRQGKIYDSFSGDLLKEMTEADIFMLNNEFTYTNRGEPTAEKQFTFRADPDKSAYLWDMGVDIVSIANNHTYDYGEISLLDTVDTLAGMEMPYVGAGRNIEEASRPFFFETDGLKIGFLSATQIERLENPDTKGATPDSAGVFRCWDGTLLYEKTAETAEECDFLVVYVHWGSENTDELDWAQKDQALRLAQSGADLIIGDHSHCLQGIDVVEGVPVFYSLGNFLFSSKTLDTCLVKAVIQDGKISGLQFLPAIQKGCSTSLLTGEEKARVLEYMRSISGNVTIDQDGYITY